MINEGGGGGGGLNRDGVAHLNAARRSLVFVLIQIGGRSEIRHDGAETYESENSLYLVVFTHENHQAVYLQM